MPELDAAILESISRDDSRSFELAVRRLADSFHFGMDASPFTGSGIEFHQSRHYESGDPVKSIDWRVSARMGKVFIKEYLSTKQVPVYLVVDTSASMTLSSTAISKYALAVALAGALAVASLDRMSPVGVIGSGSRAIHLSPTLSHPSLMRTLHHLRTYTWNESTHLTRSLQELDQRLAPRHLIIVLSDMHEPGVVAPLGCLAQRHECMVIQLSDPMELSHPVRGFVRAREAETSREATLSFSANRSGMPDLKNLLSGYQIDHLNLRTDQAPLSRLRSFLQGRLSMGRKS